MKSKFKNQYTQQEEDTDTSQDSPPSSASFDIDASLTSISSSSSKKRLEQTHTLIPITHLQLYLLTFNYYSTRVLVYIIIM
jgi:hypothetical protein